MDNLNEYEIISGKTCGCGYEFTLKDINGLEKLNIHGFYGNSVKNASFIKCPDCQKDIALLLKQRGQTWEIVAIGMKDSSQTTENTNKQENTEAVSTATVISVKKDESGFVCETCGKVCKSESGLKNHLKTHLE